MTHQIDLDLPTLIRSYMALLKQREYFDDELGCHLIHDNHAHHDPLQTGVCTVTAKLIAKAFLGKVCGYPLDLCDTDKVAHFCLGHDFAVIGDRFLVDWWGHYVETSSEALYDLHSQEDLEKVQRLYLPRDKWKTVDDFTHEQ